MHKKHMPLRLATWVLWLCLALVAGLLLLGLWRGLADLNPELAAQLWQLRATRALAAVLSGGALAVAGLLMQGLFRNPLAGPSVLGTSAGALLGGQCMVLAGAWLWPQLALHPILVPVGCLGGAGMSLVPLVLLAGRLSGVTLLLAGVMLAALLGAGSALLTSLSLGGWEIGRAMVTFTLGSLSATGMPVMVLVFPMLLVALLFSWLWSPALDVLAAGDEEARALGLDLRRLRVHLVVLCGVFTGSAAALAGGVGFVGLLVPHALRLVLGNSHRPLVLSCFVLGGIFVALCDTLCQLLGARAQLPVGVITALIGAPLLVWLLWRARHRELW